MAVKGRRQPASLSTQAWALLVKNMQLQKRRWATNLALVCTPVLFCILLWGLQELINNQLGNRNFRCGCLCTQCYDWIKIEGTDPAEYQWEFFEATDSKPCSPYANCVMHDDMVCGVQYSKVKQAGFCNVEIPPTYPAFLQIPLMLYRYPKPAYGAVDSWMPPQAVPLMYTGEDTVLSEDLMGRLLPPRLSDAELLARLLSSQMNSGAEEANGGSNGVLEIVNTFLSSGVCSGDDANKENLSDIDTDLPSGIRGLVSGKDDLMVLMADFTQALGDLGIVLGTPAGTTTSLFLEPALLPASEDESKFSDGEYSDEEEPNDAPGPLVEPLYIAMEDCASLSSSQLTGIQRASCVTELLLGRPLECVSLKPSWREDARGIDDEIHCGWRHSTCSFQNGKIVKERHRRKDGVGTHEYASAIYDWGTTSSRSLHVNIRVNDSILVSSKAENPPELQRWNQPMNMAANAFLRYKMNDNFYSVRLRGLKGMPKPASQLSIDFSSLLGPLFFMWLLQLLLPVNVQSLMYEKGNHLRIMMKMQGLDDRAFYAVNYVWQLFLYCIFVTVFVAFGAFIELTMFTRNSLGVLALFFFLWGNMMIAWGFWISSVFRTAKVAVHATVIWVIGSGLVSNLMLSQLVIRGPFWLATVMQVIPSFGLYRGLWELAQYAFLASGNGGDGLTWAKLDDEGNGMKWVFVVLSVEWIWTMFIAWYNDQVLGHGTGVRRHPLFLFMGNKRRKGSSSKATDTKAPSADMVQDLAASVSAALDSKVGDMAKTGTQRKPEQQSVKNAGSVSRSSKHHDSSSSTTGTTSSRSQKGNARVVGGTPLDDEEVFMDAGSYWGSAGSPPGSPVDLGPPIILEQLKSSDSMQDVEKQVTNKRTVSRPHGLPFADGEGPDVAAERLRVEQVWQNMEFGRHSGGECTILLRNLRKTYPAQSKGSPPKVAVGNLSVGIDKNQCFGLLGPNGAGKTTTIRMMEGFLEASSGSVLIDQMDTLSEMPNIYSIMGVCPQHDLLWGNLTAREHLMFYGKLKNLHGSELKNTVEASLKSVNLLADGVGDKLVKSFSGGMKRRLSVAISLIGDPLVVYLDEPSTGLDPSSRRLLWDVIKKAKRTKAVVLTTHSMEEAEVLCDRLGIFVQGKLVCIGNPKDLTSRYGGYLQFSLTTPIGQEELAAESIYSMCPTARPVYTLGGTQKFELPMADVQLETVFDHMTEVETSKHFSVLDWGVSNATLEEVFIKITGEAGVKMTAFTS